VICLGYAPLMLWNVATGVGTEIFLSDTNTYLASSGMTWETVATYQVIQEISDGSSFTFNGELGANGMGGTVSCRLLLNDTYVIGTISRLGGGFGTYAAATTTATSAVWDRGDIKVQVQSTIGANSGVRNIQFLGVYTPFTM